ncbi:MAG: hypothetical protein KKH28_14285 [Elusimicrobia bacterium]|nr:hypothetical protein [Elusimicrobiota bacterium]
MTIAARVLLSALLVFPVPLALAEECLPVFKLDSMQVSDITELQGVAVPAVPAPKNTGYDFGTGRGHRQREEAARPENAGSDLNGVLPERYPLYSPFKAGRIRLTSLIRLTIDAEKGKAEIEFPRVEFEDARAGDRASTFIRAAPEISSPLLSWAAVICSGRRYLGYKGSGLKLPEKSGAYSINETLALGSLKALVGKTHPWLATAPAGKASPELDHLCAADFPERMKDYKIETLPAGLDGFNFKYDPEKNALKITWKAAR